MKSSFLYDALTKDLSGPIKPLILKESDLRRPENQPYPFEKSVIIVENYKDGGDAPLNPDDLNLLFESV